MGHEILRRFLLSSEWKSRSSGRLLHISMVTVFRSGIPTLTAEDTETSSVQAQRPRRVIVQSNRRAFVGIELYAIIEVTLTLG